MKIRGFLLSACLLATIYCTDVFALPVQQSNPNSKMIDVGEVNKKALKLPLIAYPPAARAAGVHGIVKVRVWINKKGDVARASFVSGPRLLRRVAIESARGAKFPPNLGDCPLCRYVTGVLVYTFVKQDLSRSRQ